MTHTIDFAELKQRVSIERAAEMLAIKLKRSGPQLRGPCPICKEGGDRAFVVTPDKGVFFCFGCGKGGDAITLASRIRKCGLREAAEFLAGRGGAGRSPTEPDASRDGSPQPQQREGLRPLDHLQPTHEAVQALGVSPETARHFGAGYAPKGILRGRLAIPIHDRAGILIAYCGRAVREEEPQLIFPNGFDPRSLILNAHRIAARDLFLVRDPLAVLTAHESGIDNVVAFLTEDATPQQLTALAALMQERQCETVEIH